MIREIIMRYPCFIVLMPDLVGNIPEYVFRGQFYINISKQLNAQ